MNEWLNVWMNAKTNEKTHIQLVDVIPIEECVEILNIIRRFKIYMQIDTQESERERERDREREQEWENFSFISRNILKD